ncbi:MAG: Ig-like domain-containing protein, partial [Deltaproteobacteria bacterium]|nr:Ig-like domain-containing protein [Deltaproteobacteria bacterium]
VQAVLSNTSKQLPSGTLIQILFTESYELAGGARISPEPMTQDIILYRRKQGTAGYFTAAPSCTSRLKAVVKGKIKLTANVYNTPDSAGISPGLGGVVENPKGVTLTFPPGASETEFPVSMRMLPFTDPGFADDERFGIPDQVPGVEIYTGQTMPVKGGILTLQAPFPAGTQAVVVRTLTIDGITHFVMSGAGVSDGNSIIFSDNGTGLPGIRESGRYYLLTLKQPAAWITGSIQSDGVPAEKVLVKTDKFPFASIADTENPLYTLPIPLNTGVSVTGTDLMHGQSVTETVTLNSVNEVFTLDLILSPSVFSVISTIPADNDTGVNLSTPVTVTFSRKISAGTVNTESFSVSNFLSTVPGTVSVSPDGLSAVFRPSALLEQSAVYTVELTPNITDTFGNPLQGNQADGAFVFSFETKDTTPPLKPEAGQISLSIPGPENENKTQITGTQGTAEPGVLVTIRNMVNNITVSVTANDDGSFGMTSDGSPPLLLDANPGDRIEIEFMDDAGNTVSFYPGPFRNEDGTTIINSDGGIVEGLEGTGIRAVVPRGALPDGTPVKISPMGLDELAKEPAPALTFTGGIFLDMPEHITAEKEIGLSMPIPVHCPA